MIAIAKLWIIYLFWKRMLASEDGQEETKDVRALNVVWGTRSSIIRNVSLKCLISEPENIRITW